jgi:ADP-ribose pyrophosphatase YjhB (NUDIX family)
MEYKGRVFCLIERNNKILMIKSSIKGRELCSPSGGIKKGETPEQAALRDLHEECLVSGQIIKKISEYPDLFDDSTMFYTFQTFVGFSTQNNCL